ncbi:hypothetical protein Lfu02_56490 [Longispora fulva]|uniref:DNA-binding MarR family transcriptional regulator n=1 Tax=Longispora fulva TaxID=619741 RepID=A0A8J7GRF9_9ACTN|nr:MarR family transcriptional regulator [Longispora fulva]MBG6137369.1 DNA-binding MarR family transcriptional regulator [Longispora fulva]GIG61277.1 hypothetical protein Lfu02_56490 [Longispora fulva]
MPLPPHLARSLDGAPLRRLVAIAGSAVGRNWAAALSDLEGLTPAGASVLLLLARHGDRVASRDLAELSWIKPATLTGVVDTLEKSALVARERDEGDRRVVFISLTEPGRARVGQIMPRLSTVFPPSAVEADPAKEAVVREYLMELISLTCEEVELDG